MANYTNSSVAHDFYYKGARDKKTRRYQRCSISYTGTDAFSYATLVAKVIPTKGRGEDQIDTADPESALTLLSLDSMTMSTSKHLSDLYRASPFETVSVPMRMGSQHLDPDTLAVRIADRLGGLSEKLTRQRNRAEFVSLMKARERIVENASEEWSKPLADGRRFRKYEDILVNLGDTVRKLNAKMRSDAAKAASETRKALRELGEFRGRDFLDAVRMAFHPWSPVSNPRLASLSEHERTVIAKHMVRGGNAYVWLAERDGEPCVETSRGVRVGLQDVKVALRAWALGHDMRMARIGQYTVLRYEGSVIKVGCHEIPRENVIALYEAVMGKPFPARTEAQG